MTARTPTRIRIDQINNLPNITFVRWVDSYTSARSKAVVKCSIDGNEWSAEVNKLVNSGRGCPVCRCPPNWTEHDRINQINTDSVKFVGWVSSYETAYSRAWCECSSCGTKWSATVNNLVNHGRGCPKCAKYGYNPSKPGTLYALRSECGTMVKIGIANNLKQRHRILKRKTPFQFECVELCHGDGSLIATLEKVLHDLMKPVNFDRPFDGSTEWREWDDRLPMWFDFYRGVLHC